MPPMDRHDLETPTYATAVEAATAAAADGEEPPVLLHGNLDLSILEGRHLSDMNMLSEHLRPYFKACSPPSPTSCTRSRRPPHLLISLQQASLQQAPLWKVSQAGDCPLHLPPVQTRRREPHPAPLFAPPPSPISPWLTSSTAAGSLLSPGLSSTTSSPTVAAIPLPPSSSPPLAPLILPSSMPSPSSSWPSPFKCGMLAGGRCTMLGSFQMPEMAAQSRHDGRRHPHPLLPNHTQVILFLLFSLPWLPKPQGAFPPYPPFLTASPSSFSLVPPPIPES